MGAGGLYERQGLPDWQSSDQAILRNCMDLTTHFHRHWLSILVERPVRRV
jgi:hypothetical protein